MATSSGAPTSASQIVFQWLDRIGLGYAIPQFMAQGITTPQALAAVDLAQGAADQLLIRDDEDKKRLWELVHRIRAVSAAAVRGGARDASQRSALCARGGQQGARRLPRRPLRSPPPPPPRSTLTAPPTLSLSPAALPAGRVEG